MASGENAAGADKWGIGLEDSVRIESSQLAMQSAHVASRLDKVEEEVIVRAAPVIEPLQVDTVSLSQTPEPGLGDATEIMDPQLFLIQMIAAMLSGRVLKVLAPVKKVASGCPQSAAQSAARQPSVQVAVSTRRTEVHAESEQTSFAAQGVVRTADGRSITFTAELAMSRSFVSQRVISGQAGTDPLVVNLGGGPARVTGAKIDFDLNGDGQMERVSFVAGGSGFLVLDRNGDGKVNDGRELIGTKTGNGFAELAAYDADGNGWIDENDPVYAQLAIWTKDDEGREVLESLKEKGVGALATSAADTEFSLKNAGNVLEAQVRSSGVYLMEDGAAGTTQQVDLVSGDLRVPQGADSAS